MNGIWHITWATHNSRVSRRMVKYNIRPGSPLLLDAQNEILVTKIISGIAAEKRYRIFAYNICTDHVHILMECANRDISNTVRLLKGKSSQLYKEHSGISSDQTFHLWTRKFSKTLIRSRDQYHNTLNYIVNNRENTVYPLTKYWWNILL